MLQGAVHQGSVLGPLFWNLIFDKAIGIAEQGGNEPMIFADDLVVVVSTNTKKIEERANNITRALSTWCRQQKLEFSTTESEVILLKVFLDLQ